MLIVTDINSNTEALTDYTNFKRTRNDNSFSISLTVFKTDRNNHSFDLIQEESELEYDGQAFRIKQMNESTIGNRVKKDLTAQHTFYDLVDEYQYNTYGGTKTLDDFMTWTLTGTDFTYEIIDTFDSAFVPNFGEDNVLALLNTLKDVFGCEFDLDNKHIKVVKEIGNDTDFQFRYKYNVKTISKHVDTSKLSTYIKGQGNGVTAEYTSSNASKFGVKHAPLYKNDDIVDQNVLLDVIKREINDVPDIAYKVDVGQINIDVSFGDRGYIIHEVLGLDINARIMEYTDYPESIKPPEVVVGNILPSASKHITDINKNVKEVTKKTEVNRSEIRQTNDNITLEVTRLDGRVDTAQASISVNSDEIALRVKEGSVISSINQTAETIKIQASKIELTGAVTFSALDSFTQTKVSNGDAAKSKVDSWADTTDVTLINGGNIKTGTLVGDRIYGGTIEGTIFSPDGFGKISNHASYSDSIKVSANYTFIQDGYVYLGNSSYTTYLYGSTIYANGYAILTSASSINADYLGGYSASDFSLTSHNHDAAYVKQYYSGDTLEMYVSASNNLVVYKAGSLVGSVALT